MCTRTLLCLLVLLCAVQAASAFTVTSMKITPTGDLSPGEKVTTEFTLTFGFTGKWTFPDTDTLQFETALKNPKWNFERYRDEVPQAEKINPYGMPSTPWIHGFDLSYPFDNKLKVVGTLEGTVPDVTQTKKLTVIRITQMEPNGNPRSGERLEERDVVTAGDVTTTIAARERDLQELRAMMDEMEGKGIDTEAIEAKYTEAAAAISSARTAAPGVAQSHLTNAQSAINDGEKLSAEKEIGYVKNMLGELETTIRFFTHTRAMGSDPRVLELIDDRDAASQLVGQAEASLNAGKYKEAYTKAKEAESGATTTQSAALALREQVESGIVGNIGSYLYLIVGAVAVILLIAAGVVIYRRKTRWDELG
ncbi:MAG: hypothetical protein PHV57_10265 [Methanomicrobiaceae archaeon]|nr:hypothetical protein [Methanomicrobiaceae archaeon]